MTNNEHKPFPGNRVAVTTLGCKVNQYESAALMDLFREQGYVVVDFADLADVYIINTCTVTHLGNRKSRQMIRRAVKTNPEAVVAVTGCYAQTSPGEVLAIPGVNLVVGTKDRRRIVELVEEAKKSQAPLNAVTNIMEAKEFEDLQLVSYEGRTRAFIKIQEGCNNYCSYCIIPYARGPLRSRPPEKVVAEAENLVAQGFREIVLTGICTGTYGRDLGGDANLAGLLAQLSQVDGLRRLRLSSIEPTDITPGLLEVIADSPVICRHLHIPLQSGSDAVLRAMNRKYTTEEYEQLIGYIRFLIPGVAITTDIITGFPGERDEDFRTTMGFVEEVDFSDIHVFKYSPRQGTKAAEMANQVPSGIKDDRSQQLIQLAARKAREFAAGFIAQTMEVLVENTYQDDLTRWEGLTDNYLRVVFPGSPGLKGDFLDIKITGQDDVILHGLIQERFF
ncbi:MAG: tRNA (N(6)-L-threonylcarbamoyladenosine(37)-C(2))-methylthiotransferase MtaB [Clostridia bacterium]|nr:tRNA (N(6)-L-threonylcarbamoyladenosine(37)-C(2))-methylthiotransferase MtaB [Clostridia bacterium]